MSSSLFKSLSISARLGLGFGCLLVLLVAMATVGQLSLNQVNTRMQEMTGAGATKTKLVNSMLESVGSLGIQSRSSAMLNEIDPKQAQQQIQAVRKTLREYAKQERSSHNSLPQPPQAPPRLRCYSRCRQQPKRPSQRLRARCKQRTMATPSPPA